jgi:ribonuclease HI
MIIIEENNKNYKIRVKKRNENIYTDVIFNPQNKYLYIDEKNELGIFLKSNEYQFRKLLHNKRPHTFHKDFVLDFSIIDKKDIEAFNNKENIIISEGGKVRVAEDMEEGLLEIYTDGSFDEQGSTGAYGYALVEGGKVIKEYYSLSDSKSSSHLELLAVIDALTRVEGRRIRIYTDSQYVRKGITEWIFHWRENGFMTANGTKAKNSEDWIRLNELIKGRYIEWLWIKSHRDNEIHNLVDEKVRRKAKNKNPK